ncbi:MAG TPA: L-threonylcarbamoyladenylate synthase [Ktedonobacteraceae bacterium]|nr:L-threonylcarbamoyladenylate synthase [Ktedonobacteraceae bacterium]
MQDIDTKIVHIDPFHPEQEIIERAARMIREGAVVVFPTETVYGLGADALQPSALERIFAAKGRPFSDPLIVHIAEEQTLERLTTSISESARKLAEMFWPGPLTMILPRSPLVPLLVTAGLDTVAVRMPRHPVALALIRAAGTPIAAPSANRFMHISPTTAQHVYADLHGRVPLILDGGPCEVGVESTVLDMCVPVPTILRPGGVSIEALRHVLPDVQLAAPKRATSDDSDTEHAAQFSSPGQMLTHYAPTVPLLLFDGSAQAMRSAMLAEAKRRVERGERVGVLAANEDVPTFQESAVVVHSPGNASDPQQVATSLFASLRQLENAGVQVILCRNFDTHGLGLAIRDRLLKAAGGRVYECN